MIVIDTESTGLHFQHGDTTFAVGYYDGDKTHVCQKQIDPKTRKLQTPWSSSSKDHIRSLFSSDDFVVFQNARHDIRALCEMGVFDWDEPGHPEFWKNIIEMGHLVHLNDSRDARNSGLKFLARKYLKISYDSEKELDRIINRCRTYCRNHTSWKVAGHDLLPYNKASTKWHKLDMWLPFALRYQYKRQGHLQDWLKNDYDCIGSILKDYLRDDCKVPHELTSGLIGALGDAYDDPDSLIRMNSEIEHVLWKIETQGFCTRPEKIADGIAVCDRYIETLSEESKELSGIDTEKFTDAMLRDLLFNNWNLTPVSYTAKTKSPQVNFDSLVKIREQAEGDPRRFLTCQVALKKYRTKRQYLVQYGSGQATARNVPYHLNTPEDTVLIFPSLKEIGTSTTRFSGENPNPQNIEKVQDPFEDPEIQALLDESPSTKTSFGPPEGMWWLCGDYSQLQLRIFAVASREEAMVQAFKDGRDFHDFIAHVIFDLPPSATPTGPQRRAAKCCNFGFIFGATEGKINKTAGIPGVYAYLMKCFPNAHQFISDTKEMIKDTGVVYTLGGYPLHIPVTEYKGKWSYAAHMGVCYIVQGTEGEIVKRAMRKTDDYIMSSPDTMKTCRLAQQVHDEIIFQVPARIPKEHCRNLKRIMEESGQHFGVETPVDFELCINNLARKTKVIL